MFVLLQWWVFGASFATGQTQSAQPGNLPTIPPDVARQNLVTFVQPEYPPLAKAAGIQGIVHASFEVDETGRVTDLKLISGHPMLAPAALEAIRKWEYKPFLINGKTSAVRTEAQLSIPEDITQPEIDSERKFQDAYWPNERAGRAALEKGDLTTAEAKLSAARAAAENRGDAKWLELADVLSMLGTVKLEEDDFPGAEQLYKQSLAIHLTHQRPDEAEVAGAQETLGLLYIRARQPEKAEPLFLQSVKTYEARLHETSMPEPLAGYGRSLALGYFALSQIAAADGRVQEYQDRCRQAVSYAEKWAKAPDRDVITSRCEGSTNNK